MNRPTSTQTFPLDRQRVLFINTLIVGLYVAVVLVSQNPWFTLAAFLIIALITRWSTLIFMLAKTPGGMREGRSYLILNIVGGLIFALVLVAILWWLGTYWLGFVKLLTSFVMVVIAYFSLFPVPPRNAT